MTDNLTLSIATVTELVTKFKDGGAGHDAALIAAAILTAADKICATHDANSEKLRDNLYNNFYELAGNLTDC